MSIFGEKQSQEVAAHATALQANGDIHLHGLSVAEVLAIATNAAKVEFALQSDRAADIATGRAIRMCETFLEKLTREYPDGMKSSNEPSFQHALLSAQKTFALSGDEELEPMLAELLVERTKAERRGLRQLVLTECLGVVGKISEEQIAILGVSFLMRHTVMPNVVTLRQWVSSVKPLIAPLLSRLPVQPNEFTYLQYVGCGAVEIGNAPFLRVLKGSYPGILQQGFEKDDPLISLLSPAGRKLLVECDLVPGRLQLMLRDQSHLHALSLNSDISRPEFEALKNLLNRPVEENSDVLKKRISEIDSDIGNFCGYWDSTPMNQFMMTTVGIAIGHAKMRRLEPTFPDLSSWI